MHFVLDIPLRGSIYAAAQEGICIISNGCSASIYRFCEAKISSCGATYRQKGTSNMEKNQLREDSISFAIAVSDACDSIKGCSAFVNQLLRAASSIGANIHEAKYAQSRADFISKLEIALKESSETEYWLELLFRKGKMVEEQYKQLRNLCGSVRRRLIASITTAKENAK